MLVRQFEPEDAVQVSELIVQNLRQMIGLDYSQEVIEALVPSYTPEKIVERAKNQFTLVCVLDDVIVGTAALDQDRVRNVFADLRMHRRGIGKRLMMAIEAQAQAQQLETIFLLAGLSACGFYEKLGYTIVKRYDSDVNGIPLPVIRMEKGWLY